MKNDLNELLNSLLREYETLKQTKQYSKLNACAFNIRLVKEQLNKRG